MSNNDFNRVLEYTLDNEAVDFAEWVESGGNPDSHIYQSALKLQNNVCLTKEECVNLLDALSEWFSVVGPKEIEEDEDGLNDSRYTAIVNKLRQF